MRWDPPRRLSSKLPKALGIIGLHKLAAVCAARAETKHLDSALRERNTLLISGLGRTGKTILAQKLVSKYQYASLMVDMIQPYFFAIEDNDARMLLRKSIYSRIVSNNSGLILEGDDFIFSNLSSVATAKHDVDISLAIYLAKKFDLKVFLVGNAAISVDEKLAAIQRFGAKKWCWTNDMDPLQVREYTAWLIEVSRTLRDLANDKNIFYFEIDSNNFDNSIEDVAKNVVSISS